VGEFIDGARRKTQTNITAKKDFIGISFGA